MLYHYRFAGCVQGIDLAMEVVHSLVAAFCFSRNAADFLYNARKFRYNFVTYFDLSMKLGCWKLGWCIPGFEVISGLLVPELYLGGTKLDGGYPLLFGLLIL